MARWTSAAWPSRLTDFGVISRSTAPGIRLGQRPANGQGWIGSWRLPRTSVGTAIAVRCAIVTGRVGGEPLQPGDAFLARGCSNWPTSDWRSRATRGPWPGIRATGGSARALPRAPARGSGGRCWRRARRSRAAADRSTPAARGPDRARVSGWRSATLTATAAPSEIPPTTAARSRDDRAGDRSSASVAMVSDSPVAQRPGLAVRRARRRRAAGRRRRAGRGRTAGSRRRPVRAGTRTAGRAPSSR